MPQRTGMQRLEAIEGAQLRKTDFMERLEMAAGDPDTLAFLMSEAINMAIEANGLEVVGKDGRQTVSVESIFADHCMIAARKAFLTAVEQASPHETQLTDH